MKWNEIKAVQWWRWWWQWKFIVLAFTVLVLVCGIEIWMEKMLFFFTSLIYNVFFVRKNESKTVFPSLCVCARARNTIVSTHSFLFTVVHIYIYIIDVDRSFSWHLTMWTCEINLIHNLRFPVYFSVWCSNWKWKIINLILFCLGHCICCYWAFHSIGVSTVSFLSKKCHRHLNTKLRTFFISFNK